ncbi:MAG: helix-turn-helix domain-containing protein [Pseudomonadota bacterium]
MTLPADALAFSERLPSLDERQAANQLRKIISAHSNGDAQLRLLENGNTVEIALTPAMSTLLLELLRHIGKGDAVTLVPISEMLTTQQAADILNVSRPHLIKLLEQEDIPHHMVGRHRRIKAEDIFKYKRSRDCQRSDALDDLMASDSFTI